MFWVIKTSKQPNQPCPFALEVAMVPITTYQTMCADVLCEGQGDIIPSRHIHSMAPSSRSSSRVPRSKASSEPIPLYFAWNRLDPNYRDEEHGNSKKKSLTQRKEARAPPQCRLDESEAEMPPKVAPAATRTASSSHHFLVDPDFIEDDENEPFVTEYADKYRAWTIPAKNKAKKNKVRRQDERGVELALRGMGISPTPPTRKQQTQQKPSSGGVKPETVGLSPTSHAIDAPVLITCDNGTAKTSEMDEQSYLTGTTAPSTPTGSASSFRCGSGLANNETRQVPTPTPALLVPSPTPHTEKDGEMWIITSGKQPKPMSKLPRGNTGSKLRETRRDMAFWKSSSSSLGIPCPATPNHSVSKGRARRFGEKNKVGSRSTHIRSTSAVTQSCPSPQKLSKMLLMSRRGLSSTKLFPRLPNDPSRKNSLKRKV